MFSKQIACLRKDQKFKFIMGHGSQSETMVGNLGKPCCKYISLSLFGTKLHFFLTRASKSINYQISVFNIGITVCNQDVERGDILFIVP